VDLHDLFRLDNKVALVTGGGRGIGKVIAEALAGAGARVVITGRRAEWLTPAEADLRERGFDCTAVIADVTQPEDADRAVQKALDAYGAIDILVNNAGQTWGQPTEDVPLEKWRQVVETNLTGAFIMSQRVGRHMLERGQGGRIINVASVAGLVAGEAGAMPTLAYNASKAALISFTRSLAMEWGRRGILVNAIAPGWFPTRMATKTIETYQERILARSALGRIGDLNELRGAAIFLASPASSYITGQTLVVDGGLSI
jgi:gluconate 5-dehydrogenase